MVLIFLIIETVLELSFYCYIRKGCPHNIFSVFKDLFNRYV